MSCDCKHCNKVADEVLEELRGGLAWATHHRPTFGCVAMTDDPAGVDTEGKEFIRVMTTNPNEAARFLADIRQRLLAQCNWRVRLRHAAPWLLAQLMAFLAGAWVLQVVYVWLGEGR